MVDGRALEPWLLRYIFYFYWGIVLKVAKIYNGSFSVHFDNLVESL